MGVIGNNNDKLKDLYKNNFNTYVCVFISMNQD